MEYLLKSKKRKKPEKKMAIVASRININFFYENNVIYTMQYAKDKILN